MDERAESSLTNKIRDVIQASQGVCQIDSLRVHRRGPKFTIDLEIAVDGNLSVDQGHHIAADVKDNLLKNVDNICDVMIHVNPCKSEDEKCVNKSKKY